MTGIARLVGLALGLGMSMAAADPLVGTKTIRLVENDGRSTEIGQLTVRADGSYRIALEQSPFADHFLSMRPFKCLEGTEKYWFHVPYPYDLHRKVSASDLADLEYDLLFLWKGASEYGINMWNGVYYRLTIENDRIIGLLHEMDMDVLSAPPEAGDRRPIRPSDLHEADPDSHWLPRLIIE